MITNPHIGSLGNINREAGDVYTEEDEGYARRYWFGEDLDKAKEWLKKFLKSYAYMMSESYLEFLPEKAIELVREEWTIKINFDLAQMRMNDLTYQTM